MQAAKPCQPPVFGHHAKSSSPCAVLSGLLRLLQKFPADLTIAVLGSDVMQTYYADTLLALADKNSIEAAQ